MKTRNIFIFISSVIILAVILATAYWFFVLKNETCQLATRTSKISSQEIGGKVLSAEEIQAIEKSLTPTSASSTMSEAEYNKIIKSLTPKSASSTMSETEYNKIIKSLTPATTTK
jgi:uncharacterized protein YpmB